MSLPSGNDGGSTQPSKKKILPSSKVATQPSKVVAGAIEELKGNVYQFRSFQPGNKYAKTTDAIADYCGREYGKEMQHLINGTDNPPQEPTQPTSKKEYTDAWEAFRYGRN